MSVYVIYSEDFVEVHASIRSLNKSLTSMLGIVAIDHKHLSEIDWNQLDSDLDEGSVVCHHIDLFSEIVGKSYITKIDVINLDI